MNIKVLAQAILDGKQLQVDRPRPTPRKNTPYTPAWVDADNEEAVKMYSHDARLLRIKPTLEAVDLSVLLGSGIDCEFHSMDSGLIIGRLKKIDLDSPPSKKFRFWDAFRGGWHYCCLPRMNHWHSWQGGKCPLPEGLVVEATLRNGTIKKLFATEADIHQWAHQLSLGGGYDIIAFKVLGLAGGYCWPWEVQS